MRLQAYQSVDHVYTGFSKALGPLNVVLFVESL